MQVLGGLADELFERIIRRALEKTWTKGRGELKQTQATVEVARQLQPVFGVNSISSEGRYSSAVVLRPSERPRYMPCRQRGFSSALGRALGARKWE